MLTICKPAHSPSRHLPMAGNRVRAGFPSPADDYIEERLDLNQHLIAHPSATFFVRVSGESMIDAGIQDGDILVVDRSLDARHEDIVIATLDGEFTVKRLVYRGDKPWLVPSNPAYPDIRLTEEMETVIWGVVTSVIHSFR